MTDREQAGTKAQSFFDGLWKQGDYWDLDSSPFERSKYDRQIALLADRRYGRVLEVGCGSGIFTRRLAALADHVVAVDVSAVAVERARLAGPNADGIEFRVANIMDMRPDESGPWDLVVMNETIYYLGWLYSFFDVAWLAECLVTGTTRGGRFLMCNTFGEPAGYLLRTALIRTYRDLFVNAGFRLAHEEVFEGTKDEVPLRVLVSLFEKPAKVPDDTTDRS